MREFPFLWSGQDDPASLHLWPTEWDVQTPPAQQNGATPSWQAEETQHHGSHVWVPKILLYDMKLQATSVFIPSYLGRKSCCGPQNPNIYPRNAVAFNTSGKWEGLNGWTGGSRTTLKRLGHRYKMPSCWHSCSVLIKTFWMRPGFYAPCWPGCAKPLQSALSPGVDICICAALHWPPAPSFSCGFP